MIVKGKKPTTFLKRSEHDEENTPLAGFYDTGNYWIYFKQKSGSSKVETIIQKGSIGDLRKRVPKGVPIYDMVNVSSLVLMEYRPIEIDRKDGKCTFPDFQKAIEQEGAIRIW